MSTPITEQPVFYQPAMLPPILLDMYKAMAHAKNTASQKAAAINIINEYISFFGADGMRADMQGMLLAATGNPVVQALAGTAGQQDIVFFYEFTLLYFDAVYVLHGKERYGKMGMEV